MESIKIQFTNPDTGLEQFDTVRFDIAKYRKDESGQPAENIFFTSASTNVFGKKEIVDLAEAAIVANPMNPYGCSVVYGLIKVKPSGSTIDTTVNPQKLGFVNGEPVALLADFEATPSFILTPTSVTTTSLGFGDTIDNSVKAGWVVVKLTVPSPFAATWSSEDSWGAKALLERPNAPTVDAVGSSGSITATLTKPTTKKTTAKQYEVFVVSATDEPDFNPLIPVIKANRKADATATPPTGATVEAVATTWGGGTNYGGGTITTGTYYVVAVTKDGTADMGDVQVSALSNVDTVVVSY